MRKTTRTMAVLASSLVLVVAACGSDDEDE
jgi:uncharacterized lipoprotein